MMALLTLYLILSFVISTKRKQQQEENKTVNDFIFLNQSFSYTIFKIIEYLSNFLKELLTTKIINV